MKAGVVAREHPLRSPETFGTVLHGGTDEVLVILRQTILGLLLNDSLLIVLCLL